MDKIPRENFVVQWQELLHRISHLEVLLLGTVAGLVSVYGVILTYGIETTQRYWGSFALLAGLSVAMLQVSGLIVFHGNILLDLEKRSGGELTAFSNHFKFLSTSFYATYLVCTVAPGIATMTILTLYINKSAGWGIYGIGGLGLALAVGGIGIVRDLRKGALKNS